MTATRIISFSEGGDYTEIYHYAANLRGIVINTITMLERTIDTFLAYHYTKDNSSRLELMNTVFATKHISFEAKRMIFDHLTSTHHAEYKKLNLEGVHAKLDKFNKHRNALAHYVLDLKPDAIELFKKEKRVTFLKFEKSIENVTYTVEEILAIESEIYSFIKPIAKMLGI